MSNAWEFITKGGWVMYGVLLPLSIFALGLIIERFYAYFCMRNDLPHLFASLDEYAQRGALDDAIQDFRGRKQLGARLMADMIERRTEGLPTVRSVAAAEVDLHYLPLLEQRVGLLSTIAKAAPMLGLFGTIQGMIGAFSQISSGQKVQTEKLAGDISVALNTTFGGLAIAIPIVFALTYIRKVIQRYEIDFERCSHYVQKTLSQHERQAR